MHEAAETAASERTGPPLPGRFFARPAHQVAPELVGCTLLHDGVGGTIIETEAYEEHEPACHAFRGRTAANEALFGPAASAYVYVSYGIHRCFNIVTGEPGRGEAVLIRALEPVHGVELMRQRRGVRDPASLCSGPGRLGAALGIGLGCSGMPVLEAPFAVLAPSDEPPPTVAGPRIGISKATDLQWRFCASGSPLVSRPRPQRPP